MIALHPEDLENIIEAITMHIAENYSGSGSTEEILFDLTGAPSLEIMALNAYFPSARYNTERYFARHKVTIESLLHNALIGRYAQKPLTKKIKEFILKNLADDESYEQRQFLFYALNEDTLGFALERSFVHFLHRAGAQVSKDIFAAGDAKSLPKEEKEKLIRDYSRKFTEDMGEDQLFRIVSAFSSFLHNKTGYWMDVEEKSDGRRLHGQEVHKIQIYKGKIDDISDPALAVYLVPYDRLSMKTYGDKELESTQGNLNFLNPRMLGKVEIGGKEYMIESEAGWRNMAEDMHEWKIRDSGRKFLATAYALSAVYFGNLIGLFGEQGLGILPQLGVFAALSLAVPNLSGLSRKPLKETANSMARNFAHLHFVLGDLSRYGITEDELSYRSSKHQILSEFSHNGVEQPQEDIEPATGYFLENITERLRPEFTDILAQMAKAYGVVAEQLKTDNPAAYLDTKMENFVRYDAANFETYITNIRKGKLTKRMENRHMVVKYTHRPLAGWHKNDEIYHRRKNRGFLTKTRALLTFNMIDLNIVLESLLITPLFGDRYERLVKSASKLDYNGIISDTKAMVLSKLLESGRVYKEKEALGFIREYREAAGLEVQSGNWLPEYHAAIIHMSMLNIGKTQRNRDYPYPIPDAAYSAAAALYHMLQLKKLGIEGETQANGKKELENLFDSTKSFIKKCSEYRLG